MTTTRDVTAVEAENTQLAERNAELLTAYVESQRRLNETLDAFNTEREHRKRADTVARAVRAQRKAAAEWEKHPDDPVTRHAIRETRTTTDRALAAWVEFETE